MRGLACVGATLVCVCESNQHVGGNGVLFGRIPVYRQFKSQYESCMSLVVRPSISSACRV